MLKTIQNKLNLIYVNNDEHTHMDRRTGSTDILDMAFISQNLAIHDIQSQIGVDLGSNHLPIEIPIDTTPLRNISTNHTKYKFDQTDREVFESILEEALGSEDFSGQLSTSDLDRYADFIITALHTAVDKAIPKSKSLRPESNPISNETLALIKEKRKLRRQYSQMKDPAVKTRINQLQKQVKDDLRVESQASWEKFCSISLETDSNESWRKIKNFLKPTGQRDYPTLQHANKVAKTNADKAQLFAESVKRHFGIESDHFDSNHFNEVNNFIEDNYQYFYPPEDPDDYRLDVGNEHELVADVDAQTLLKLIKFLKRGKAPGPDTIHNEVLRLGTTTSLFHHLARLFTSSIQLGYIPTAWKLATLRMFLKPDKPITLTTSYRPISLINSTMKLFERVIEQRLRSLTFQPHFEDILERCNSRYYRLWQLANKKWGPSPATLIQIYKQCVRPIFEYSSLSTITISDNIIIKIQRLQNKFIRLALRLPKCILPKLLHDSAGLPYVKDRLLSCATKSLDRIAQNPLVGASISSNRLSPA